MADITLKWIIDNLSIQGKNTKQMVLKRLKYATCDELLELMHSIQEELRKKAE